MTRFRGFSASLAAAMGLAFVFVGAAAAQDEATQPEETSHKLQIRNFDHFEYDTTTGPYFGIATFYTKDNNVAFKGARVDTEVEAVTSEFRLVYGGETAQFGVMIPYHFTKGNDLSNGENDVGDIRTHLKAVPLRTEFFDLGGALQITFPAGSESDGTSTGNIGILPFGTGTVHIGPVDVNGHFGYEFINNEEPNGSSESFLYGGSVKVGILDNLGALLEVPVQTFTARRSRTVAAIQPGVMYQIPFDHVAVLLSLSGSYTFTGGTAGDRGGQSSLWGLNTKSGLSRGEWGIGGAVGFTFY